MLKLLDAGVSIDARGMGQHPLIVATQAGAAASIKHGADAHARNDRGATPLLHACVEGLADGSRFCCGLAPWLSRGSRGRTILRLRSRADEADSLLAAATNGYLVITNMLLDAGADPCRRLTRRPRVRQCKRLLTLMPPRR